MRVIWRGDTEQMHPEFGLLRPGEPVAGVTPERCAGLAQDASGLFEIVEETRAEPPRRAARRVDPAPLGADSVMRPTAEETD